MNKMPSRLRSVLSLFAGVVIMIGVGSIYALSAWNAQLKAQLQYSQAGIATVSSMTMLGSYMSYFPGILFDRLGPYNSILLGGIGLAWTYWVMFMALMYYPTLVTPVLLGSCLMLVGVLSAFCIFSSIVPNEGLFGAANRGKVMALLTSAYSCGGALFAFIYHAAFSGDVGGYFCFVGGFLLVMCLFGWCTFVQAKDQRRLSYEIIDGNAGVALDDKTELITDTNDVTGIELLTDGRFWLLFVQVLIVIGAGLLVMSNVSFIVESLSGPMDQVPIMVALFSASNTIGRLATGAASDHMLPWYPRAYFLGLSALLTAITHVVFLTIPSSMLAIPVVMAGLSEGIMFGCFPVILRETFGLKHYGKNYGLLSLANCIGYPLIYSPLSSFVYQRAAVANGEKKCFGDACFRPMFLLVILLCGFTLICCLKLIQIQQRHLRYQRIP